jgi:formate-dependent nitrite reductase membrane component NrfD
MMTPLQVPQPARDPTYYSKPILKEPVWIWTVPLYFYVGGVSGAALVLGAVTRLIGGAGLRPLVRKCHWVGFVGGGIGSVLLIADLGRPERFLAMLRVLRLRSPMSVGSWILAVAPPCAGAAAVFGDPFSSLLAGLLGVPLSGYTAVLLSNTAIPVWHETRTSLPALFMGSAAAGAAQVLKLLPVTLPRQALSAVNTFGIAGSIAELAAGCVVEQHAGRIPIIGQPLYEGVSGALWKASKAMTVAGLVLSIFGRSRGACRAGAILGTAGAIALRFAIFHAGKASAREPRATFHLQRQGALLEGAGNGARIAEGGRTA